MLDAAPGVRNDRLRAEAALVVVTFLWGMSFPWMRRWQDAAAGCPGGPLLSGLTLIALRMALASALVLLLQPRLLTRATRREHAAGAAIGLAFGVGFALQVWGIASTMPSRSAFFTSLCCAWTPLFGWVFFRLPVGLLQLVGLALGLAGAACFVEEDWRLGFGDTLTLAASLFFAAQLLLLDRLGRGVDSARATPAFFAMTGALAGAGGLAAAAAGDGVAAWGRWLAGMLADRAIARDVFLMALLPTFAAFWLMNRYQPRIAANRAALIYLLEPVFTAIISVSLGFEGLTGPLLVGGLLILTGNVVVEVAGWLRPQGDGA
jgi:drug/metabolite transporter (DMT)-like permease